MLHKAFFSIGNAYNYVGYLIKQSECDDFNECKKHVLILSENNEYFHVYFTIFISQ